MTPINQMIVQNVLEISPRLKISSQWRANAGYHTAGMATDFICDDWSLVFETFCVLLNTGWPGGVSIGITPAAMHLHVDARHLPEYASNRCHFIETALWNPKTYSCGEVFSPTSHKLDGRGLDLWNQTFEKARALYNGKNKRR